MAGHSKWANIKHKKGATDAKRGKIFSKISKEIITATRIAGNDPDTNLRLRAAIVLGKSQNMPNDNISRAIKKGSGELSSNEVYEELTYEGYGPGGIAILVECMTENRNRTASEVRTAFNKANGSLGTQGSVNWMFEKKAILNCNTESGDDYLLELLIDFDIENIITKGDNNFQIIAAPDSFSNIFKHLEKNSINVETAKQTYQPNNTLNVETVSDAKKILHLIELLNDLEDVQDVHNNALIADSIVEQI